MMNVMFSGLMERQHVFEDQIAEGDKVATHLTLHAVHTGEFQGMPATGKRLPSARSLSNVSKMARLWNTGRCLSS